LLKSAAAEAPQIESRELLRQCNGTDDGMNMVGDGELLDAGT